jgi:acetyl-CoA carboxylase alpha subunit
LRVEELRTAARAVRIIRTPAGAAVATEAIRHRTSVEPAARRAIRIVRTAGVMIRVARTSSAARPFFSGPSASPAPALAESILKVLKLPLPLLSLVVGQGSGDLLVHLFDQRVYLGFSLFLDITERIESCLGDLSDLLLLFGGKVQDTFKALRHH